MVKWLTQELSSDSSWFHTLMHIQGEMLLYLLPQLQDSCQGTQHQSDKPMSDTMETISTPSPSECLVDRFGCNWPWWSGELNRGGEYIGTTYISKFSCSWAGTLILELILELNWSTLQYTALPRYLPWRPYHIPHHEQSDDMHNEYHLPMRCLQQMDPWTNDLDNIRKLRRGKYVRCQVSFFWRVMWNLN